MFYAHSCNFPGGTRHELVEHLRHVAAGGRAFALPFGGADPAYYAGLWHDLGKFHPDFQRYLAQCEEGKAPRRGPDHKAAGVTLARRFAPYLTLVLQGHHGGLQTRTDLDAWLHTQDLQHIEEALALAHGAIPDLEPPGGEPILPPAFARADPVECELFLRMLFSALVDADYLDTERHFNLGKATSRSAPVTLESLLERLNKDQLRFGEPAGALASARAEIFRHSLGAAEAPPGLFKLTVPTGGGKTRSGMAFALKHAIQHGLERVIVAIPFISITEQTAQVYRDIFQAPGESVVLEHHSGARLDEAGAADDFSQAAVWGRLASENWDAPIVVTTTVRLFESLFSNATRDTRRLHRLARSVIILDEAQSLPVGLLEPILDALRQLCSNYGTTVVLSTATQPAFDAIKPFAALPATEIIPQPQRYFQALKRVKYEWLVDVPMSWTAVAARLKTSKQGLAVVNTKKDAMALLNALDDPSVLHLSTLLCGKHRHEVIQEVKARLRSGAPCILVSTQVIEAGVDLDFPFVMRAMAPLDSIIQAAGRCNREGRPDSGAVVVFRPEDGGWPSPLYKEMAAITEGLLREGVVDPDSAQGARLYFQRLFESLGKDLDKKKIQELRKNWKYPDVARAFRMIEDDTESVVVERPQDAAQVRDCLGMLAGDGPARRTALRRLQPYLVGVYGKQLPGFERAGIVEAILPGLWVWKGGYDRIRGLVVQARDPDSMIV